MLPVSFNSDSPCLLNGIVLKRASLVTKITTIEQEHTRGHLVESITNIRLNVYVSSSLCNLGVSHYVGIKGDL